MTVAARPLPVPMKALGQAMRGRPLCTWTLNIPLTRCTGGVCVLMQELIQDAVVAMDGHTYEREAILSWFEERPAGFSFGTKKRLPSKLLLPNKGTGALWCS